MSAARKQDKYPIQVLSLPAIKVDHSIQSRVATSVEHQRDISEGVLRGDVPEPIVVFFDGKTYWLSAGFHRLGAYKQAAKLDPKFAGIRAEIRPGGRREAIIFSTGSNKKTLLRMTPEDIQKAIHMLLDDPEWFGKPTGVISRHVGCSEPTVRRARAHYCDERGIVPEYPIRRGPRKPRRLSKRHGGYCNTTTYLAYRGLSFHGIGHTYSGHLSAMIGHNAVCVSAGGHTGHFAELVGMVLMARHAAGKPTDRCVILCIKADIPSSLVEIAEGMGIELLTPDELAASIHGKAQD